MIRRISLWVTTLCIGLVAASCSSSSLPVCPPEEAAVSASASDLATGYVLGPGDQMRITVFRHQDLSGEFQLDGEGVLSLPLVGEIQAGGRTVRQLERQIETKFKEDGYLVEPRISIQVLIYRPFYILGEVNQPGEYEYTSAMTVTNAVALAGGFTYRADQDDIQIRRGDCVVEANAGSKVLPGEVVVVPERFF